MTLEQRVAFVRLLHERRGLSQVRITGGEPLLDPRAADLIAALRDEMPDLTLAMTTNGRRLVSLAGALRAAGLDRLNVSLDSLDPTAYQHITGGRLTEVIEGLDAADAEGFPPARINVVVLRGLNDHELPELARWAVARGSEIRFLEAMPIGPAATFNRRHFVPAAEMRLLLRAHFALTPLDRRPGETARRYSAVANATRGGLARTTAERTRTERLCSGVVGLIAPVTEPFCTECRRIRLTADGRLYPCLLDDRCVDVRQTWSASNFDLAALDALLHRAVEGKRPRGPRQQATQMVQLGG
jgi:cyclic pyranopterin phosphate synthase